MTTERLGDLAVRLCSAIALLDVVCSRLQRDELTELLDGCFVAAARWLDDGITAFHRHLAELLELLPYLEDPVGVNEVRRQMSRVLRDALLLARSQGDLALTTARAAQSIAEIHAGSRDLEDATTRITGACRALESAWIRASAELKGATAVIWWDSPDDGGTLDALSTLHRHADTDSRRARAAYRWLLRFDANDLSQLAEARDRAPG